MPDFTPYQIQERYPHMAPNDTAIWTRFIHQYPKAYIKVAYDVAVGEGANFDTVVNKETGGDVGKLYQRKIDVLARTDEGYDLIEVKPRASTSALGQVKNYWRLLGRDLPGLGTVRPVIVTDILVPEMQYLADIEGVKIVVV